MDFIFVGHNKVSINNSLHVDLLSFVLLSILPPSNFTIKFHSILRLQLRDEYYSLNQAFLFFCKIDEMLQIIRTRRQEVPTSVYRRWMFLLHSLKQLLHPPFLLPVGLHCFQFYFRPSSLFLIAFGSCISIWSNSTHFFMMYWTAHFLRSFRS